jgi:hypothetical protein
MTQNYYWLSFNEEEYQKFETFEQALEFGKIHDETFWIGEGPQKELRLAPLFNVREWIERLEEYELEDVIDPEFGLNLLPSDLDGLDSAIKSAIDTWQDSLPAKLFQWHIEWTVAPKSYYQPLDTPPPPR